MSASIGFVDMLVIFLVLRSIVILCGLSDASRRTFTVLCGPLGSQEVLCGFSEVFCGPVRCLVVPDTALLLYECLSHTLMQWDQEVPFIVKQLIIADVIKATRL